MYSFIMAILKIFFKLFDRRKKKSEEKGKYARKEDNPSASFPRLGYNALNQPYADHGSLRRPIALTKLTPSNRSLSSIIFTAAREAGQKDTMTKRTHQGNVCEQCPPNVRKVLEPRAFEDGNDDSPSPSDSPMTIGVDADRFNTTTNLVEEMLRDTIDIKSSIEGVKNKCRHGHKRLKHQLAQLQRDLDDRVEDNPSRNEQAGRRGNLSQQEDGALAKRIAQLKEDNEELARENVKLQKANRGYVEKILDIQPHRYELLPDAAAEVCARL